MIQLVGSKKQKSSLFLLLFLKVALPTQRTQLHQFTQHKQLLHSRISHNKHGRSSVTSSHASMFICCCNLTFCPFCLLFCCCVYLTLSLCFFLYILFPPIPPTSFSLFLAHRPLHAFCLPPTHDRVSILRPRVLPTLLLFCLSVPSCLSGCLSITLCLSFSLSHLPAFRKEFQSQLFILELLQAHHDGILVYAGLSSAGHQSYTHQLLLHPPYQLCSAHGPRGGQGRHFSLLVHARRGWAISMGQLFIIWLAVVGQHILKIEGEEEKKRERPQHLKSKLWIFGVWITTLAGKIFTIDLSSCMMTLIWGGKCTSNISEFWITKADTKISFRSYFHSKSDAWLIRQWKHVFVFRFWFCFGFF